MGHDHGHDDGGDGDHDHSSHGHDDHHSHDDNHPDADAHYSDADEHHAHDEDVVAIGVLTVSTSRSLEDDPAGDVIVAACESAGHEIVSRRLVADDVTAIENAVVAMLEDDDADVVLTAGGTGLTPDDVTVDALRPLFDRPVPGFGELFRWLSYEEVGPMAMASRATAGVVDDRLVFCLPGSENAARTGAEKLVAPAVGHLLGLVRR